MRNPLATPLPTGSPVGGRPDAMQTMPAWHPRACENVNKRRVVVLAAGCTAWLLFAGPGLAQVAGQTPTHDAVADEHGAHAGDAHADAAHAEGAHHEESLWVTVARVANFALLAGGLFYFLRAPIAAHLDSRGQQIRGDLAIAAQVRADATQRLAAIEQSLKALPTELELVRQRGVEEVAAEELRMAQQAEIERGRLVAQARREIEQHARTARQALTEHAASLVIGVAEARLRDTLTDDEQRRLADEFTGRIGSVR